MEEYVVRDGDVCKTVNTRVLVAFLRFGAAKGRGRLYLTFSALHHFTTFRVRSCPRASLNSGTDIVCRIASSYIQALRETEARIEPLMRSSMRLSILSSAIAASPRRWPGWRLNKQSALQFDFIHAIFPMTFQRFKLLSGAEMHLIADALCGWVSRSAILVWLCCQGFRDLSKHCQTSLCQGVEGRRACLRLPVMAQLREETPKFCT